MAKTNEELNEIKKECEELGKKLSELTDEELSSVVGGSGGESERYIKPDFFTGHVPAENVKVDGYYYFTFDDEDKWFSGRVYKIEEESWFIFWTQRIYYVYITGYNGQGASGDVILKSREVTAYTDWQKKW